MYISLVILGLVAVAHASPLHSKEGMQRKYDPTEEDPNRQTYILMEDDEGKIHNFSLTADYPEIRATNSDVKFYVYTRSNPSNGYQIPATSFSGVAASPFDQRRNSVFISHGWNNNYQSPVNTKITAALLQREDINVFVIDWSAIASKFYTTAKSAVPDIGVIVGQFIQYILETYRLSYDDFKLVGHSLGAHVVGCAGAQLNGRIGTIIGLDPAGPLYVLSDRDNRLDDTDGRMVEIIHTNGGTLGITSAIGDADYFPNGGSSQPGCTLDVVGTCAHARAYEYYAESVISSGFFSVLCDAYSNFSNGQCRSNARSYLGELDIDKQANGDFYLDTSNSSPYALGVI